MPTGQQYATNVPQAQLTAGISGATTNFGVNSLSGWPATPFTAILDIGQTNQEAIDVLTVSGNTITSCTRGLDGSAALSHGINATMTHGDIGRDFREARAHIDASGPTDTQSHSVHGITLGTVVSTGDTQTLVNKTFTAPVVNAATFSGTVAMGTGAWSGTGSLVQNTLQATGSAGATSPIRLTGGTNGGAPSTGTYNTGDVVSDSLYNVLWICTAGGSPGTWAPLSTRVLVASNSPSGVSTTGFTPSTIPSQFKHLEIEYTARTSNAGGIGSDYITLTLNGAATANYWWRASGVSQTGAGVPSVFTDGNTGSAMNCGLVWSSHFATNGSGRGIIEFVNYAETTFFKEVNWRAASGDGTNASLSVTGGGLFNGSTGAITSITISTTSGNFLAGSTFNLYAVL